VPAIWLGLTDATVDNGSLRVVPRSHRLGMLSHRLRQTHLDLASSSTSDREPGSADGDDNELSVKLAKVPEGLNAPFEVVMQAGEMSFHHPLALHGSNPNASVQDRAGPLRAVEVEDQPATGIPYGPHFVAGVRRDAVDDVRRYL
jgi:ectoine hydroxylase-related dioxygenase (phytanoyl-CoA dioxygenase family)